MRVNSDIR